MSDDAAAKSVTVSIVSHGHAPMIANLLRDLVASPPATRIVLTYNVQEPPADIPAELRSRTTVIANTRPAGFAANHNAAFRQCETPFFCVMNPDIRLPADPFRPLLACMADDGVALAAPAVLSPKGRIESTARCFPTPFGLLLKFFRIDDGGVPFDVGGASLRPDWIAGMFLLVRSEAFTSVGGFDTKFHLYYEDVDLCARLRRAGHELLFCPGVSVVHDARRSSHRELRFMVWHLQSMMRYFVRHLGRLPARRQAT